MATLKPFEQIDAGGVDSRSNPINMPRNRALRCLNWVPKQAGFWELRWGYSTVTMSTVTATAIHSMFPYRTWDGHKYVLYMQGTTLKTLDTATGTVTTPTVKGTAVASSAKGMGYFAANRFHYGNGTDQKWFDATSWRDNGLPANFAVGSSLDISNVAVNLGVREVTTAEASGIGLTAVAGGSFPTDQTGRLLYTAYFDPATNEVGPATVFVGSGRIVTASGNKISLGSLPNFATPAWYTLIAGTGDGGNVAFFYTNTSTNLNSCTRSGSTLTVSATGHGLSTQNVVILAGTGNFDGIYSATVIDANTFTVQLAATNLNANTGAVGTVKRIVYFNHVGTTIDVLAPTQDTSYQANQNRGLALSTVGGPNPGYQLYAAIYNQNGGGHVGNRVAVGPRIVSFGASVNRSNLRITGLPNITAVNSEWVWLIGRTIDGGQTPYVTTDPVGNWVTTGGNVTLYFTQGDVDGSHEMPTRNGVIPSQCNMFCVAGDFCYAGDTGSPYLRRSGDMSQNTERGNTFTGRAEQSWAPNDIDTFPTGEACTGLFEIDQEVLMGTLHDTAISVNLAGIQQWIGPWAVGMAGRRAGTKCGSHGFYWLTGDKQLATLSQGVPVIVSEEYELAELSQIGDAFLSTVELLYFRSAGPQSKDELRIEGQKADGTPYTIIHDFQTREVYSAPGSLYGQGYSSQFLGPLSTVFTSTQIRDGNGKLQIFAGASTGQIYQLYSGANDAGTEYTSDLILLVNGGPDRPNVPFFDYYGDANIKITVGRNLSTSLATGAQFGFDPPGADANVAQLVPGAEFDFLYRAFLVPSEVQRLYVRFQLTSHSGDGNLNLNSPPHIPLESYGRLYEIIPAIGDERER